MAMSRETVQGAPLHAEPAALDPKKRSGSLGLIINTYNQPDYLVRVLTAVSGQFSRPDEVLLADDGSGRETKAAFSKWASGQQPIRTEHVRQEHEGFRRARILNEAIARARSEYLVFLDGDTVPHPQFIADHRQLQRLGKFIQGHRALLKERGAGWFGLGQFGSDRSRALCAAQLQGWKHAFRWPWPMVRTRHDLRGVRGCNLAIWRKDLLLVNGYNEEFVGWGREDSELAVRLMNSGIQRLDARGWALCYHLWHPVASRDGLETNDELLAKAQRDRTTRCKIGLEQHLPGKA
jgi:glycosyltransferase involved in cell wall biosynthesis